MNLKSRGEHELCVDYFIKRNRGKKKRKGVAVCVYSKRGGRWERMGEGTANKEDIVFSWRTNSEVVC